jgi:hypothetical protein
LIVFPHEHQVGPANGAVIATTCATSGNESSGSGSLAYTMASYP